MKLSKEEIIQQLNDESEKLVAWFAPENDHSLESGPDGAWTAGQHLLHMIKSTKPLAVGLGYPRFLLRLKYGKAKSPSDSFEKVIQKYKAALDAGGQATGVYVPRTVKNSERDALIGRFRSEMKKLTGNIAKWPESSLDKLVVPHPLLGNLTIREMLYFTIYHTSHHTGILEERY